MFRSRALTRPVARLLVCFYVLASCRALVPGLCATLAAVEAPQQSVAQSSVAAAHSCCSLAQPPQNSTNAPARKAPATKCAFCELAKGFVTPSPAVTLNFIAEQLTEPAWLEVPTPHTARFWDPGLARDPPSPVQV
ncbi:MAG: hypothetical protein AMXMBFR82_47500 [Candidatus Hydrogenedentota bacterium]